MKVETKGKSEVVGKLLAPAVILVALYVVIVNFVHSTPTFDFPSYYYGAKLAASGGNPYSWFDLSATGPTGTNIYPFLYSPLALQLFGPLGMMPFFASQLVLGFLNIVALWVTMFLTRKLVARQQEERQGSNFLSPEVISGLVGLALLYPIILNMACGQINLILAALITGSLYLAEKDRPVVSGGLLAIAAVVKLLPAGFILYLLLRKRSMAALWCVSWSVGLTGLSFMLGAQLWPEFIQGIQLASFGKTAPGLVAPATPNNLGWAGAFARLFGSGTQISVLATFAALVGCIALIAWLGRKLGDKPNAGPALLLVTAFIVFAPPLSWLHYFVYFIPALGLLVDQVQSSLSPQLARKWLWWMATLVVVGGANNTNVTRIYGHLTHWKPFDPMRPPIVIQPFYDLNLLAMLAVCAMALVLVRRSGEALGAEH